MNPWTQHTHDDLIAALRAAGYDTPHSLAQEFVRRGSEVVDALCAVLRDPEVWACVRGPGVMLPVHALMLLGAIADPRSAPAVLEVARARDLEEYTWEDVPRVLAAFGVPMMPDLKALAADVRATYRARGSAMLAMYLLARDHAALRPQVEAFLVEMFAAPDLDPKLVLVLCEISERVGSETVGAAVREASARDPHDAELRSFASSLEASPSEGWQQNQSDGDLLDHFGPGGTLEIARENARRAREFSSKNVPALMPPARPPLATVVLAPPRAAPPLAARAASKLGRNDPCSCGSGKKYKKCCGQ